MRLSVLDQAPIASGSTGAEAVRNSLDLAIHVERLGYHRYWVAEHHGTPALACASPEALIGPIAQATTTIRCGSGGVMLPHYSPRKVAETFSMLSGLYPGRIDLGIGRAPGTDRLSAFALQRDRRIPSPDDFPEQLTELLGYTRDSLPPDHPFRRISPLPGHPAAPEIWLLGSSPDSGTWAAEMGLPYAFADFINPDGAHLVARYRERFVSSSAPDAPRVIAAVWVTCGETDEEARRLSSSARMMFRLLYQGQLIAVPTVDEALRFLASSPSPAQLSRRRRRNIVGSPETVRDQILEAAREYDADEVMIVTITHSHEARRRSYELIAEAFDLKRTP